MEDKRREQAGLQKERLLLEKRAKKKQAEADKKVRACTRRRQAEGQGGRAGGVLHCVEQDSAPTAAPA